MFQSAHVLDAAPGVGFQDVAPDGQRFLIIGDMVRTDRSSEEIVVIDNWDQELLDRVPVP